MKTYFKITLNISSNLRVIKISLLFCVELLIEFHSGVLGPIHTERQRQRWRLSWFYGTGLEPVFKYHDKNHSVWIVQLWIHDIHSARPRSVWTHL